MPANTREKQLGLVEMNSSLKMAIIADWILLKYLQAYPEDKFNLENFGVEEDDDGALSVWVIPPLQDGLSKKFENFVNSLVSGLASQTVITENPSAPNQAVASYYRPASRGRVQPSKPIPWAKATPVSDAVWATATPVKSPLQPSETLPSATLASDQDPSEPLPSAALANDPSEPSATATLVNDPFETLPSATATLVNDPSETLPLATATLASDQDPSEPLPSATLANDPSEPSATATLVNDPAPTRPSFSRKRNPQLDTEDNQHLKTEPVESIENIEANQGARGLKA